MCLRGSCSAVVSLLIDELLVSMRVLYITHDGLSDNIGQSQVLPYILGWQMRATRFTGGQCREGGKAGLRKGDCVTTSVGGVDWQLLRT